MQEIKQQLEDLSFAALHPKRYAEIDSLVAVRTPQRDHYLAEVVAEVQARLGELKIEAEVTGRGKHLWSIYEKMVLKGREFDDIFDLVGIRVIVDSVKDCYAALGLHPRRVEAGGGSVQGLHRHAQVQPVPVAAHHGDRAGGKPLEVQIRTREMHQRAEWGVAAHWAYKEGSPSDDLAWLNRIMDWQAETERPGPVHGDPEDRPRAGRGLRLHAEGPRHHAAGGLHADRLRLRGAHRGRARLHRGPGERAARPARLQAERPATPARSSRRRSAGPAPAGTG